MTAPGEMLVEAVRDLRASQESPHQLWEVGAADQQIDLEHRAIKLRVLGAILVSWHLLYGRARSPFRRKGPVKQGWLAMELAEASNSDVSTLPETGIPLRRPQG